MTARSIPAGEFVFKEGDPSDAVYFIQQGQVEIHKRASHGSVLLATLSKGSVFGEMGLFESRPRSASAKAAEDTQLLVIGQDELQQMISQCPEPVVAIMRVSFERLQSINRRLVEREAAQVNLPCDFQQIVIAPASAQLMESFAPTTITLMQLPYTIGGTSRDDTKIKLSDSSTLSLPCDGPPLAISKRHVGIEIQEQSVFLVDRGSRFGTTVNGRALGRGKGIYKIPLQKGEFNVQFGPTPAYCIKLICQ